MNTSDIRQKVDQINIELASSIAQFILNDDRVHFLQNELDDIQKKCQHAFVNGQCVYCDKKEETNA